MKAYTIHNFLHDLQTDIWMLKEIGKLPDNPPTEVTSTYDEATGITNHRVKFFDDICMPARQEAVTHYRKSLSPVFFTLAQKVYAELFRLVLGQSNLPSRKKQVKTQGQVGEWINKNLGSDLVVSPVFKDREEFDDWWQGRYKYSDLREARSRITHEHYSFKNGQLVVKDENGVIFLNWTTNEVFAFAQCVLTKASQFVSNP